jgi:hypothetical protein
MCQAGSVKNLYMIYSGTKTAPHPACGHLLPGAKKNKKPEQISPFRRAHVLNRLKHVRAMAGQVS